MEIEREEASGRERGRFGRGERRANKKKLKRKEKTILF